MKRKLSWGTKRRIGTIIYIAMILAVDAFLIIRWVTVRQEKVREVEKLETPREIANHFMREEYNRRWYDMKGVTGGRIGFYEFKGEYFYEVDRRDENDLSFSIVRDADNIDAWGDTKERAIICERHLDSPKVDFNSCYYNHGNQIDEIRGSVTIYYDSKRYGEKWEKFYFIILRENEEYMVDPIAEIFSGNKITDEDELIEKTGMTVEEIVETAYRDQEIMEETMYEMKAYELDYLNGTVKKSMWKKILWTGGISLFLIIIGIISEAVDRWYAE